MVSFASSQWRSVFRHVCEGSPGGWDNHTTPLQVLEGSKLHEDQSCLGERRLVEDSILAMTKRADVGQRLRSVKMLLLLR